MSLTLKILLTTVTVILAIIVGLMLRRWLVRRLKNTILDAWATQTLGVVIFFPPILLAAAIIPIIWNPIIIFSYWDNIQTNFLAKHIDLTAIVGNGIETLLLVGLGIGVARTAQKVIIRGLGENRIDINIRTLIGRIFYIIILTFAAFWVLSVWQVSIGIPVAAITVISLAVTFAVQDILKDLVAGFYILVERPFHIGDQVSTATYTGKVEDVQLRATKLRLVSGEEVTIPNALVFGGTVVNNTYYGERRATITVTLDEAEFVQGETAEKMLKAIQELEHVMVKPEPAVSLTGYTAEKKAVLLVRFWVASRQPSTVSDVVYILHKVLPNADLTVTEFAGDV